MLDSENQQRVEGLAGKVSRLRGVSVCVTLCVSLYVCVCLLCTINVSCVWLTCTIILLFIEHIFA